MANLMLSVMGAFAEFERSLIRERQKEGIALAKQRGAYKGRKKTLTPERAAEPVQRAGNGVPKALLARDYGISRETVYQYLRHAKLECIAPLPRPSLAMFTRPQLMEGQIIGVRAGPHPRCFDEVLLPGCRPGASKTPPESPMWSTNLRGGYDFVSFGWLV
ncbi:hypothetical protein QFZ36_002700 [Pseudarthrobacter siccitolerans]|uniref:Resolvase/invertase-type recombinase catalytic domain-containing protein n=1 Tax=Pseudarthrobacter siccitolerans TaxID=861266 RepID=A0ABU0PPI1_9MICC|nr:hypothetical protein [Pseudarthrobacter siccitolerans]